MSFDDIVSVLSRAFGLELKVVQDTTVFEVDSEDRRATRSTPSPLPS